MTAAVPAHDLTRPRGAVRGQSRQRIEALGERLTLVADPLRIAMFVLTILNISRVHQHYRAIGRLRPALLLVAAAVVYAYLNPRYLTRENVLKLWPMRSIAVLGVLACCSAAFGISLGGSASYILDGYAKVIAYTFLVAVSIRHVRDLYTFVWAYVIACGILAYFAIFVFGLSQGNSHVARLSNLYTYDANDVGVVMMIGMALTMLLLGVVSGKRRLLVLLILLGIVATIARSGSRGGFLGFVVAAGAALLLVNSISAGRRMALLVATLTALAVAAPPGYWMQMRTITQPTADYNYSSVDGRWALIQRGLGYMEKYPVFGLGINNFGRAECSISPKLASLRINGPVRCKAPHNSYLQAGTELGVPGFLVWLSLVVGGVFAPLRLRRRLPVAWRRGTEAERFLYGATSFFPVAMVGFAVTSFFVSFAWSDTLHLLSALLTGLYVAVRVQMAGNIRTASGDSVHGAASNQTVGWRVKQSARHS